MKGFSEIEVICLYFIYNIFDFYFMSQLQIFGAFWYFLGIERQDACWIEFCSKNLDCNNNKSYLYCGNHRQNLVNWQNISSEAFRKECAGGDDGSAFFDFGIYGQAVTSGILATRIFVTKYCYCLWWGLQNLRYSSPFIYNCVRQHFPFSNIIIFFYCFYLMFFL